MSSVLIIHQGSIGDTIVIIPLLRAIREHFKGKKIIMLIVGDDRHAKWILTGTNLIDEFLNINPCEKGFSSRWVLVLKTVRRIRQQKAKEAIFLIRTFDLKRKLKSKIIFKYKVLLFSSGCQVHFGFSQASIDSSNKKKITTLLFDSLVRDGLSLDLNFNFEANLKLTQEEQSIGKDTFERGAKPNKLNVAICIGGNQSVCQWPYEKWKNVLNDIINRYGVNIFFIGGPGDQEKIDDMIKILKYGIPVINLNLREMAAFLKNMDIYVGHDTGLIHLASSMRVKCLGIYSAHDLPYLWHPLESKSIVIRKDFPCMGCKFKICPISTPAPCIALISESEVLREFNNLIENNSFTK